MKGMQRLPARVSVGPPSGPPLWMIHGVTRRWQTFLPLFPMLSLRWELWGIDQRGHGEALRGSSYFVKDYVDDLAEALEQTSGPRLALYGHSLGAMVALGAAARVPQRVRALVLEDPPFHTMGKRLNSTRLASYFRGLFELLQEGPGLHELLDRLPALEYVDPIEGTRVTLGQVRDAAAIRFSAWCLTQVDPSILAPVVSEQWLEGFDWQLAASKVDCPTLLLQADPKAGGMLTDEDLRDLQATLRDATVTTWSGLGHNLHEARPAEIGARVLAFLETVRN